MLSQGESEIPMCIHWKICDLLVFRVEALTIHFTRTLCCMTKCFQFSAQDSDVLFVLLIKKQDY